MALEASLDLTAGLALGGATGDEMLGCRAAAHASYGDGVDRAVQGSVAPAVEPVTDDAAAAGGDRAGAGERCEVPPLFWRLSILV